METERRIVIAADTEDGWRFLDRQNGTTMDPTNAARFETLDEAAEERPEGMGPSWKIRVLTISFEIS